jgi:hypothetical protein
MSKIYFHQKEQSIKMLVHNYVMKLYYIYITVRIINKAKFLPFRNYIKEDGSIVPREKFG